VHPPLRGQELVDGSVQLFLAGHVCAVLATTGNCIAPAAGELHLQLAHWQERLVYVGCRDAQKCPRHARGHAPGLLGASRHQRHPAAPQLLVSAELEDIHLALVAHARQAKPNRHHTYKALPADVRVHGELEYRRVDRRVKSVSFERRIYSFADNIHLPRHCGHRWRVDDRGGVLRGLVVWAEQLFVGHLTITIIRRSHKK
jgi:hypothetical protein